MNPDESTRFRDMLENKYAELMGSHRCAEDLAIERVADPADEAVFANDRELLVDALNRRAGLLSQVVEALRRFDDGAFGVCAQCGESISCKRLNAVPWAALCLGCQELADRRLKHAVQSQFLHAA